MFIGRVGGMERVARMGCQGNGASGAVDTASDLGDAKHGAHHKLER